jgi:hypothetical protein
MTPWTVITKLHFLHNLRMNPSARVLHYTRMKRLAIDKHFILLVQFISYEDNDVAP